MKLTDGSPPLSESRATLANWRSAPFNRWAFHHVRELVPCADIPNDPARVVQLPERPAKFALDAFLEETGTDALVVLHRGERVFERYANGMSEETPHILMSVSKSMLGLLAGILVERRLLSVEAQVTQYVPEVANTAYAGVTVRQLLDMRAGIFFPEDYLASSGPIIEYRKAMGWNPLPPGEAPSDLHSFYAHLDKPEGRHGGNFHYVSPNTDLLGWAIERATGRRYAELMSELVWKPIGAARSAYITVDRLGAPRCAGGMCVTAADLARVGQWIVDGGYPAMPWIDDIERNGDAPAWDAGSFAPYFPGLPMHYRSKWYVHRGAAPLAFGFGIHGQNLWVDRANRIVIAKLSSQALPLDARLIELTLREVLRIRTLLLSRPG